jgi:hypothetical protein
MFFVMFQMNGSTGFVEQFLYVLIVLLGGDQFSGTLSAAGGS